MGLLKDFLESGMRSPKSWYSKHHLKKEVTKSYVPNKNLTKTEAVRNLIAAKGK